MNADTPSRDSILRALRKAHREWPTFLSDSAPAAEKAALTLTDDEREEAFGKAAIYVEACKKRRESICSFGRFLSEKRWLKLAELGIDAHGDEPVRARSYQPFGKAWSALRLSELLKPMRTLPPLPPIDLLVIERKPEMEATIWREHRDKHGWPEVVKLDDRAREFKPVSVPETIAELAAGFHQVKRGGDLEAAWKSLHFIRKWPWIPSSGKFEWVYFPAIEDGPHSLDDAVAAALEAFRRKVEGHVHAAAE